VVTLVSINASALADKHAVNTRIEHKEYLKTVRYPSGVLYHIFVR
jgi:hypothetical protein